MVDRGAERNCEKQHLHQGHKITWGLSVYRSRLHASPSLQLHNRKCQLQINEAEVAGFKHFVEPALGHQGEGLMFPRGCVRTRNARFNATSTVGLSHSRHMA